MNYYNEMLHILNNTVNKGWKNYKLGKYLPFEGGEKVRPYFETKVVKVKTKKEIGCRHETITWDGEDKTVRCKLCGEILIWGVEYKDFFPFVGTKKISENKGNWVNGENLDKIKFPCFCSFDNCGKKCYGKIDKNLDDSVNEEFIISDITKQTKGLSVKYGYPSLKKMIEEREIKILKGRIILFEEE